MKMGFHGGLGVMVVMAMMMVMGAQVEAQAVSCLSVSGASAPFGDANAVVQQLRVRAGPCCPTGSAFCSPVATAGNAVASVCGLWSPCPSCADVGNDLYQVLTQCNYGNNAVQGSYSPDASSQSLLYLTSNTVRP